MPATDAIQPLHRLSFTDLSPEGVQGIAMNPVAPTVYVHVHQQLVDPLAAVIAYWPWVLTPLAVLLLAFILWRTRRILSRPQRKGVPHCRKCNYDLSGRVEATTTVPLSLAALSEGEGRGEGSIPPGLPTSSTPLTPSSSRCPECGRPLTPRSIRQGRSTHRRLVPLATPTALLFASVGAIVAVAFGWRPKLPAHPSPTLQRFADSLGLTPPAALTVKASVLLEVDLATGKRLGTVLAHAPPFEDFELSPSGDTIVVLAAPQGPFVQYSTRSGLERRRLDVPHVPRTSDRRDTICGFAQDNSAVYLRVSDSQSGPTARIARWSLVDGSVSTAAEVPIDAKNDLLASLKTRVRYIAHRAFVIPGAKSRIVAMPSIPNYPDGMPFPITINDGPGQPVASASLAIWPSYGACPHPDGSRLYLAGQHGLVIVDTTTLGVIARIAPPEARSRMSGFDVGVDAAGSLVMVDSLFPDRDSGGTLELWDTRASTWRTPLRIPKDWQASNAQFSSDAQFVAAIGLNVPRAPAPRELIIWNIAALRAGPTPAAP